MTVKNRIAIIAPLMLLCSPLVIIHGIVLTQLNSPYLLLLSVGLNAQALQCFNTAGGVGSIPNSLSALGGFSNLPVGTTLSELMAAGNNNNHNNNNLGSISANGPVGASGFGSMVGPSMFQNAGLLGGSGASFGAKMFQGGGAHTDSFGITQAGPAANLSELTSNQQMMQLRQAQATLQQQLDQFNAAPTSMLDMSRAENILAAMASATPTTAASITTPSQQQLLEMAVNMPGMASNFIGNQIGAQNMRLNGLLPGTNDLFQVKNQAFATLATNHGLTGMGGNGFDQLASLQQQMNDHGSDIFNKSPRRQSEHGGTGSLTPLRKRLSGVGTGRLSGTSEMKLAAELVALDEEASDMDRRGRGGISTSFTSTKQKDMREFRSPSGSSSGRKKAKSFPVKLMEALIENPNEEAIAWLPDGKSFVIVQPDLFCAEVLRGVFKESKYASFVRKLHRWGFVRLTSGTGTDCFHHPMFQQNQMELASRIVCTPRDSTRCNEAKGKSGSGGNNGSSKSQLPSINDKPPSLAGVEKFFRTKLSSSSLTSR